MFARVADYQVRSDLIIGAIASENDYTSNFTSTLRRLLNSHSLTGLSATSLVVQPKFERYSGTDAAFILQSGSFAKIALFEAKWPRFGQANYSWDSEQTAAGLSHFSDQLDRQSKLDRHFAIFEMFYCELPREHGPSFLNPHLSSCVWYREAAAFRVARREPNALWSQDELAAMLTGSRHDIGDMLRAVGECLEGKPLPSVDPMSTAREYGVSGSVLAIEAKSSGVPRAGQDPASRRRRRMNR